MASFELVSNSSDGHIRALSRAVQTASRVSKEALLEFTPRKMRLCTRTDTLLIKFVFDHEFFTSYQCDRRRRCYVNLRALYMPFKSSILTADREPRAQIKFRCSLGTKTNDREKIVFEIGADPPAAMLTYTLSTNDINPERIQQLSAINRKIQYSRVLMKPRQTKKERFLLSAFTAFTAEIDQVTIIATNQAVRFVGSASPILSTNTTSEFTHPRDDFVTLEVKQDSEDDPPRPLAITVPLKHLKSFLTFVETARVQTFPRYEFEGVGLPAHFIYESELFKGHFISSTPTEFAPIVMDLSMPANSSPNPNESFLVDFIGADDVAEEPANDFDIDEEDGYNDNQSDLSGGHLDGNLENFDPTNLDKSFLGGGTVRSLVGTESIRGEVGRRTYDPKKAREILNPDLDPDDIENVVIRYSSSDSDED